MSVLPTNLLDNIALILIIYIGTFVIIKYVIKPYVWEPLIKTEGFKEFSGDNKNSEDQIEWFKKKNDR